MNYKFKNKLLHRYAEADYGFYLTRNSSLGFAVVGGDAEAMFSNGMTSLAIIMSEGVVFFCLILMVIFMGMTDAIAKYKQERKKEVDEALSDLQAQADGKGKD